MVDVTENGRVARHIEDLTDMVRDVISSIAGLYANSGMFLPELDTWHLRERNV